jgi:xylulokinase
VVGGGSSSPQWLEIIAAALKLDLLVPDQGHYGAALGAAKLAFAAATGESMTSICIKPRVSNTVRPNPSLVEQYQLSYEKYRRLYPSLYG